MSCIQQNFPSKFEPNDAFYEKLEENTFVAFILKHPVDTYQLPASELVMQPHFLFSQMLWNELEGYWGMLCSNVLQ